MKKCQNQKNVIEPDEILSSYGINATRIFMISDSPPDRELEWTDEGIQSSKNLIVRIEKYFAQEQKGDAQRAEKMVEKFIYNVEKNILNFSLNKCVADIYNIFNYLEKEKIYLYDHELSKKILCCLFPIVPNLSKTVNERLFKSKKNLQIGQ